MMRSTLHPAHGRQGTIMVLVIWVVLILSVIAYSLAYEMRISLKMTGQGIKRIKAQGLARVGLARAVTDLRNDRLITMADSGRNNDTLDDIWANTKEKIDVKHGGGTYSVVTVDEDRKLNLNALQVANLGIMNYLLESVSGMDEKLANGVSAAIVDFKDPDLIPILGGDGDEIQYFTWWGHQNFARVLAPDWVFRPKNDNFMTLGEVLDIPGITSEILFGDPTDPANDPFDKAHERRKEDSKALADYVTVYSALSGGGQLNLNTCPEKLLEAILVGSTHNKMDVKWAEKIVRARQNLMRKRGPEGYGLTNLNQLIQEGVPADKITAIAQVFPLISFSSVIFTITARGEYDGVRATIKAVVSVDPQPYSLDQMDKRERRRDPRASGELNNQVNLVIDPEVHVIQITEF